MLTSLSRVAAATALLSLSVACSSNNGPQEEELKGSLSDASEVLRSDDSFYEEHIVSVKKGMNLKLSMVSSDFDTYLIAVPPDGSAEPMNDDCHEDEPERGSCLDLTTHIGGDWKIIANSYAPGATGAYTLEYKISKP